MNEGERVEIVSRDYWIKVIEMLQQNWALIDGIENGRAHVWFVMDGSGVFDELEFASYADAERALRRNGFWRFAEDTEAQEFIATPEPPFDRQPHPNGPIYSTGRYWKSGRSRGDE